MSGESNDWLWLSIGRLEARMDRAERDIREIKRKAPREPVQVKELAPYALGAALLFLIAIGKITLSEAVQTLAGLRGQ